MKRLFISVPPDKAFLRVFSKYRDAYGRQTPYLRWTPVSNLHLTVLFIGTVPERKIPELSRNLAQTLENMPPPVLEFEKVIYAPPVPHQTRPPVPSMVWALFKENESFNELTLKTAKIAEGCGIGVADTFNFKKEKIPHITLARFRKSFAPGKLMRLKRTGVEGETMYADTCELMESKTTPNGAIYTPLARFSLEHVQRTHGGETR